MNDTSLLIYFAILVSGIGRVACRLRVAHRYLFRSLSGIRYNHLLDFYDLIAHLAIGRSFCSVDFPARHETRTISTRSRS